MKLKTVIAVAVGLSVNAAFASAASKGTSLTTQLHKTQRASVHDEAKSERASLASALKAQRAAITDGPGTSADKKAERAVLTANAAEARALIASTEKGELAAITAGSFKSAAGLTVTISPDGKISVKD